MTKASNCTTLNIVDFHKKYATPVSYGISNYHAILTDNSTLTYKAPKISDYTTMNIFNGGQQADNNLDFKKFMIVPVENVSFAEALQMCTKVYGIIKKILTQYNHSKYDSINGGFLPNLSSNEEALAIIMNAIYEAGYQPGKQLGIAIDASASSLFDGCIYNFSGEGAVRTSIEMIEYYAMLIRNYPIIFLRDSLAKSDRIGWKLFIRQLEDTIKMISINPLTIDIEFSL